MTVLQSDRQTDRQTDKDKKPFNEFLSDIGYPYADSEKEKEDSEKERFIQSSDIEILKKCQIPLEYHYDKTSLRTALEFFAEWNSAYSGFTVETEKKLYQQIINCLFEFLSKDTTHFKKQNININYTNVFEAVNRKIQAYGELYSWITMAMNKWKKVVSRTKITNTAAYMKLCIWNWLSSSELEIEENANEYKAQAEIGGYNSYKHTPSYDMNMFHGNDEYLKMLQRSMPQIQDG